MAEEKEDAKDAEEENAPKKSKLKLIIIAVVILLIGAGGIYGYNVYNKGKEEKVKTSKNR